MAKAMKQDSAPLIPLNAERIKRRLGWQLSQFGLNPDDWNLVLKSRSRKGTELNYELIHFRNPAFRLSGEASVIQFSSEKSQPRIVPETAFWKSIRAHFDI